MNNILIIQRENTTPIAIPYPTQTQAEHALNHDPLVDDLCATNSLECYLDTTIPADAEIILPN